MATMQTHPLRRYLDRAGITIARLSDMADVPRSSLSRFLSGQRSLSAASLSRVAHATGMPMEKLLPDGPIRVRR